MAIRVSTAGKPSHIVRDEQTRVPLEPAPQRDPFDPEPSPLFRSYGVALKSREEAIEEVSQAYLEIVGERIITAADARRGREDLISCLIALGLSGAEIDKAIG